MRRPVAESAGSSRGRLEVASVVMAFAVLHAGAPEACARLAIVSRADEICEA